MTPPEHGTRKTKWVAAAALSWAVVGVLWAQVILLPYPLLPPPSLAELLGRIPATSRPERFIVMLFKETNLLLTAYEEGRDATAPGCAARDVRGTGVATFYPPTDLSRLSSAGYLPGMDRFLGASPGTVPGRYRHLSPVSHVDPGDFPGLRRRRPDSSAGAVGAVWRAPACPIAWWGCRGISFRAFGAVRSR